MTAARRLALLVALAACSLAACSDRGSSGGARQGPAPAVPVTVADAVQRDVPVRITAVGNVQAYTTVSVKSQIAGQIVQVHFREGQDVKKGALLFTIDPRPFEAALRQAEAALVQRRAEIRQAEANLARDVAQMENARVQQERYSTLVAKELIAREQFDQVRTTAAALEATVNADRAAVENTKAAALAAQATADTARLQLNYTTIRAPMDGRTGNIMVQMGNVVKGNDDGPLVVISQVHPIYISFAVPEQNLGDIKRYGAVSPLKVEAFPDKAGPPALGDLTFVNSTVDPSTGTIQLKATFANTDNALWPGQFLDVLLTLTTQPNAIVVPTEAVQAGQQGPFVFVLKSDRTVESRPVTVGRRLEREVVIDKGLAPSERVITEGHLRLAPGAKVDVKTKS